MIEYSELDKECINLCKAINRIDGLRTVSSCYGHNKDRFNIYFMVGELTNLPILLYYLDACHVGFNWNCFVHTDCGMSPVKFRLESETIGEESYREAEIIATKLNEYLDNERQSA